MAISLHAQPVPASAALPAAPAGRSRAWLREPLLHFVALGALLFAIDYGVNAREDDPRVIVIDAAVDAEARAVFKRARGREPGAAEIEALHQAWLDNEVLYREGLAMQVDRGDTMIRDRVIFKALSIVNAGLPRLTADEATLRAWFEMNRAKYDEPARYTFQEAVLAGDSSESGARAFVSRLNGGESGDAGAGLRVFRDRPRDNLIQSYGEAFAAALEASPPGSWQAFATTSGWRAMRLDAATPAKPAEFAVIANVVAQDWLDETAAAKRTEAVRAMAAKYRIRREVAAP